LKFKTAGTESIPTLTKELFPIVPKLKNLISFSTNASLAHIRFGGGGVGRT
jgi:hypothetical protein